MYNWSTDTKKLKTKEQKTIWELEQAVNFGLNGIKINRMLLKKYWGNLNLDPDRKRYLELILWNTRSRKS